MVFTGSEKALRLLSRRYLLKNKRGEVIETPEELFARVAAWAALPEIIYHPDNYDPRGGHRIDFSDLEQIKIKWKNKPDDFRGYTLGRFKLNEWHIERLINLYERLAKEGKMKRNLSIILEELKEGKYHEAARIAEKFYKLMEQQKVMPNSPALMNAGTKLNQASACFTVEVYDDIESIFDTAKEMAAIQKTGGGVGINLSNLRPGLNAAETLSAITGIPADELRKSIAFGASVEETGGYSSGAVSFLKNLYDKVLEAVKQGGKRRGAGMAILDYWHAEIFDFIKLKKDNDGKNLVPNFNISVGTDEKFWSAVEKDEKITLKSRKQKVEKEYRVVSTETVIGEGAASTTMEKKLVAMEGPYYRVTSIEEYDVVDVPARKILRETAEMAWKVADPGMLFFDNANKYNPLLKSRGEIRVSNPCVVGNTKILTEDGEYEIEFLYRIARKEANTKPSVRLIDGEQKIQPDGDPYAYELPMKIYSWENGRLVKTSAFVWKMGTKETIKIKTRFTELEGDLEHRILTENGWKRLDEIKPTDRIWLYNNRVFIIDEVIEVQRTGKKPVYTLTVPEYHNYIANGTISHNCGEEIIYPYESCNLASVNVEKFVKDDDTFDWKGFTKTVMLTARMLDNFLDMNKFPLKKIEKASLDTRRIGVGMMGIANAMYRLGIKYNSKEGFDFIEKLAETLTFYAYVESVKLAKERGPFPAYDESFYKEGKLPVRGYMEGDYNKEARKQFEKLSVEPPIAGELPWNTLVEAIKKYGVRNLEVTTIPPTGSVSMIADTSSGIEPVFGLTFVKSVSVGDFSYANDVFIKKLKEKGCSNEKITELLNLIADNKGTLQGIEHECIDDELRRVFVTAMEIHWADHIMAQAVAQKWITTSISKTINMPNNATVEDIEAAYVLAHELGAKGITVYRDGSLNYQVYSTTGDVEIKPELSDYTREKIKELIKERPWLREYLEHVIGNEKQQLPQFTLSLGSIQRTTKKQSTIKKKSVKDVDPELLGEVYCPVCYENGELVELIHEAGCVTCPKCGWSKCVVG